MKQHMVVTNVRMPTEDWMQVKAAAGDMGMSVNQYVNYVINRYSSFHMVPTKKMHAQWKAHRLSIWDLPSVAKRIKRKPMGLSTEDRSIYGE